MDFERDGGNTTGIVAGIQQNIRQLNEQISLLETWIPRLTARSAEGDHVRQLFNEKAQSLQQLSKDTNHLMKQLVDRSHNDRTLRVHRERLSNEFASVLNRLQAAQRKAASKEKDDVKSIRDLALSEEENMRRYERDVIDAQRQVQMQRSQQVNLQEIKDRQATIAQLERDISDVNQIFADLARIVHDQGDMVDSIEANVEHAQIHVEQGGRDVQQAVYYNQQARKKKMMLCVFLMILVLILALTVYFGIK
ncbi:unnamed protein product, partial [Mesorhabditis belari]|uniref:t-SNARE coiled-coil homology domain-containing protein n=1 Tax=Mesorhabditis belari TaxID=2138241 RepID=A0AAF3F232_9BILA